MHIFTSVTISKMRFFASASILLCLATFVMDMTEGAKDDDSEEMMLGVGLMSHMLKNGAKRMMGLLNSNDYIQKLQEAFTELSQKIAEMSGEAAGMAQGTLANEMKKFQKLKEENAPREKFEELLKQMAPDL